MTQFPEHEHEHTHDAQGVMLVPLDGSASAEQALPVAERLALALGWRVLLARVSTLVTWTAIMASEGAPVIPEVYQRMLDDEDEMTRAYLAKQAATLTAKGVETQIVQGQGDPASFLIDLEQQRHISLTVMTTHGRTGLARFALGSVANRLLHGAHAPVLLLRAFGRDCAPDPLAKILVPLDGSALAEQALPVALRLAGGIAQDVLLLRVAQAEATSEEIASLRSYLADVDERMRPAFSARGCRLTSDALLGEVAEQLTRRAEADCRMIIMTTHGRRGVSRWALGSVADRALHGGVTPLLLVRSGQANAFAAATEAPRETR